MQRSSEATVSKVGSAQARRYDAPVRIALVSTYDHPTRDSIERMLTAAFPEYQIENFSVVDVLMWNTPSAIKLHLDAIKDRWVGSMRQRREKPRTEATPARPPECSL